MNFFIILILILNVQLLKYVLCLNVKFRANYDAEVEPFNTQIYKRELLQFFDKASYSFNGFKKIESIPVLFPIDICILNLEGIKYAASLHRNRNGIRHFAVHKMNNGSYHELIDIPKPQAIAMDCRGLGSKGYIAIAFNFSTPVEDAREGSPIYELNNDRLRAIQYFATANLVNVYLRVQGNDIMLLQTFKNTKSTPNLHCPYFKWSGSTFNRVGRIPCTNAYHLEPFSIDYENYVAVANYADQRGRTLTYSEIYKFIREKKKFQLFQKIKTNGAVDVRYFNVPIDVARRQHFLIFGNSISSTTNHLSGDEVKGKNFEADSIIYVFDKGQFVPYQSLNFYAVKQFLPIQNVDAEKFLLLVASSNQDIKIYNLNDWKFEESKAQFTEGALGKGVARMRIFQEQEQSYLVIANEKMADNETNIFLPIFKQEEHANALRQQIIDWAKENMERLKRIDVEQLQLAVEEKLKNPTISYTKISDIPNAKIETVITESLTSNRLHMNSNYWKALNYAERALNALELEHSQHQLHKREIINDSQLNNNDFEHIQVDTLIVRNKLEAENINGVSNKLPIFKNIKAKEIIVTGNYIAPASDLDNSENFESLLNTNKSNMKELNVENLTVIGKINNITWQHLLNNTLKIDERQQFIKSKAHIENVLTEKVVISSDEANGWKLSKLVPIDGGSYTVDQNILFENYVFAKNLTIHNRLNHLHITNKKFDVLMRKSNETQVITGPKRLHNVQFLEPINVRGTLSGDHLRSISPNRAVHDDLVLQGDYIINGDVTIKKFLATVDLMDTKTNTSAKSIMNNGLRVDIPLENVNIVFETPIEANNSKISFINRKDMQELVKSNTDMPQLMEGLKIFKQNLIIENGFSEVKYLNGIDTEILAEKLLLKTTNQTITSPFHIGRVLAKGLQTQNLTLKSKPLSKFLTKSGNQKINGNLKVEKLVVDNLEAHNLNTNGQIFDKNHTELYQQKPKALRNTSFFQNLQKFNGTIYVKNLVINASLNEKSITELEYQLMQLEGNIKYVGNYKFNYEMNIQNLTFHKQFNGIDAADFGYCWLQKTGQQVFTAPQTLASVEFQSGTILKGKLNGYNLMDFYEKTYWINRKEYIKDAIFQNPIVLQKSLYTKTLNGHNIPADMLYRSSNAAQYLQNVLTIDKDIKIVGNILNTTILNGFNLDLLKRFLNSASTESTLYLRNAYFSYAPKYKTLNQYQLQQILDTIWLSNENVELPYHVEISEANFEGLLDFEGPINNMNLEFLKQNYMSRTKQQKIFVGAVFMKDVIFESIMQADQIHLLGPLINAESKSMFNFDEFVSNTLKTSGNHEVRNNWTINEAIVAGNLNDVTINDLNLATDVIRIDSENIITAEKVISGANTKIEKLYTTEQSNVNDVNMVDWFKNAIYTHKNQTIFGITTLDNSNLDKVNVAGYVNGLKFVKENLWLNNQDQLVQGKIIIRNKLTKDQHIMANNIQNLNTDFINNKNVNDFLESTIIKTTKNPQTQLVETHLIFEQPLMVSKYSNDEDNDDVNEFKNKRQTTAETNKWKKLTQTLENLQNSVKAKETVLTQIQLTQVIPTNATTLIYLPILFDGVILNLIGIANDSSSEALKFYRWDEEGESFLSYDEALTWLPKDINTLKIFKLIFGTTDYLTVKHAVHNREFGENIISSDGFKELLNLQHKENTFLEPLKLNEKDCFAAYGVNIENVKIYCLVIEKDRPDLKVRLQSELNITVKQIRMLSNKRIALLTENDVEIFDTLDKLKRQERIIFKVPSKAQNLATACINEVTYLGITTTAERNTLLQETVEIYCSNNEDPFKFEQSLKFDFEIQQIEFLCLEESQDLLLLIRTKVDKHSLYVYQLQGVKGFQQIFSGGILSTTSQMQILQLRSKQKYFVALFNAFGISLIEFVLKTL